jgi:hypothetical protein
VSSVVRSIPALTLGLSPRTAGGVEVACSLLYSCTGAQPQLVPSPLSKSWLPVDPALQLQGDGGRPAAVVAGDAAATGDDKTAFAAEVQGEHAALVVLHRDRHPQGQRGGGGAAPPPTHPQAVTGAAALPCLYCVSLGPRDGILVFNGLVLSGLLGGLVAALVKWFIEVTKVMEARGSWLGAMIWRLAHPVTFFMNKWVLRRGPAPQRTRQDDGPRLKVA